LASGEVTPFSEHSARLLEEIGRTLAGSDDDQGTVRLAARKAVPDLADLIVLVLPQDGQKTRLEVIHDHGAREEPIADMVRPLLPALRRLALSDLRRGRRSRLIPKVTVPATRFLRREPAVLKLLNRLQIQSLGSWAAWRSREPGRGARSERPTWP
jgi:hypothetical protein